MNLCSRRAYSPFLTPKTASKLAGYTRSLSSSSDVPAGRSKRSCLLLQRVNSAFAGGGEVVVFNEGLIDDATEVVAGGAVAGSQGGVGDVGHAHAGLAFEHFHQNRIEALFI